MLFKNKIHPLVLFALLISSIVWLLKAFESYSDQETGLSVLYTLLFILLFGLMIWGFTSNKRLGNKKK